MEIFWAILLIALLILVGGGAVLWGILKIFLWILKSIVKTVRDVIR